MALIAHTSLARLKTSTLRIRSKSLCMSSSTIATPYQQIFSVAPMMAHTNRHFRTFWRYISKKSVLYTEMVVADMIVTAASQGNSFQIDKHFGHNSDIEDPLVLQLGGNDPEKLRQAAEIAYHSGFRSINLNCGCPSNTVASSNSMGAAMMYTPERTAQCCAAIISALTSLQTSDGYRISNEPLDANLATTTKIIISSEINFSVKCRTGVDDLDSYEDLHNFVKVVSSQGGVRRFQIHARKAILGES
jgi:tRNA-dihydrouridine synthase A